MKKRILYVTVLLMLLSVVLFGYGKKSYFQKRDGAEAAMEDHGSGADATNAGNSATSEEISGGDENVPPSDATGGSTTKDTTDGSPQEVIVKVYVYNDSDAVVTESISGAEVSDKSGLIDINNASKEELMTLSGIGSGKADAIISYRDEQGRFNEISDIRSVSGIGDGTFDKIKDKITV